MSDDDLVTRIIDAHGGIQMWRQVRELHIHLSSGGLAFATKGVPRVLRDVHVVLSREQQSAELVGSSPQPWQVAFADTRALAGALARLRTGSRWVRWRTADVAAFAAAALSTYISLPFLLAEPDVQVSRCEPDSRHPGWDRVDIVFPARIPTHCRHQTIYVDRHGRILRHDYTALAFGPWARAAQLLDGYADFDGLLVATNRVVHPRMPLGPGPGWPTLVWIQMQEIKVLR